MSHYRKNLLAFRWQQPDLAQAMDEAEGAAHKAGPVQTLIVCQARRALVWATAGNMVKAAAALTGELDGET